MYQKNIVSACNLQPLHKKSQTDGILLVGAVEWTPTMYIRLVQDFGLECEVAQHLAKSYGDRAFAVAKMASLTGTFVLLFLILQNQKRFSYLYALYNFFQGQNLLLERDIDPANC